MNFADLNVLNDHFTTIGQKLSSAFSKTPEESNTVDCERSMCVNLTTDQEISGILRSLKNKIVVVMVEKAINF